MFHNLTDVVKQGDWLIGGVNGTFSTNRLYHAFEKNDAVKKLKSWESWKRYVFEIRKMKPLQSRLYRGRPSTWNISQE